MRFNVCVRTRERDARSLRKVINERERARDERKREKEGIEEDEERTGRAGEEWR